jgi:cytochrome c oxidase subunit 2
VTRLRSLAAVGLALAARAALADPLPEPAFGLPRDVSANGHEVDELLHFTLASVTVIFLAALAALAWAMVRHRRAHPAEFSHGTRRSIGLVLGVVALVLVAVDGNLFVTTVVDLHKNLWNFAAAEAAPGALRIEITAHQWAWAVRYPGPDGTFNSAGDVVTLNDLRVPTGVPVVIQLASTDVIHSLYLPNLRVKQDAVPGMVTRLTFEAVQPGEYEMACAQHCGPNHYKMRGVLTALPPERFAEWLETARADARRGYDAEDAAARWGWAWREP